MYVRWVGWGGDYKTICKSLKIYAKKLLQPFWTKDKLTSINLLKKKRGQKIVFVYGHKSNFLPSCRKKVFSQSYFMSVFDWCNIIYTRPLPLLSNLRMSSTIQPLDLWSELPTALIMVSYICGRVNLLHSRRDLHTFVFICKAPSTSLHYMLSTLILACVTVVTGCCWKS